MDFKLFGSILLIVGTSIGAGMLALPIATAELGFVGSLILLVACWFIMTAGALLILEVNLWLPQESNLISMAKATVGPAGQLIAWITYLLLLNSLLCAYIAGGSDLFHHLLLNAGIDFPVAASAIIFTVLFSSVVFFGIRSVDYVNRGLMLVKFLAYFLLLGLLVPFIATDKLIDGNLHFLTSSTAIMVTITSFGYAAIVPSLRVYFAGDIKKLKKAIIIGSLIPLLIYIAWDMAIMGIIPIQGDQGLVSILHSQSSTSDLANTLSATVSRGSVTFFTKLFTSVCVLTSFLGVALCLVDFWADGLQLEKQGKNRFFIHAITFLPSLLIVLFFPNIFIKALEYAGIYCVILLILLPAWMAWRGRYQRRLVGQFSTPGGKTLLLGLLLFALVLMVNGIF